MDSTFLIGRTQTVVLDGEFSNEVPVTSGVPQGSVLGPLLLLLYINDLPENIQPQVGLFADDTAVCLTVSSLQDSQVLQSDLDSLQCWERTWDMEFNPSKCQVLHITRSRKPICPQGIPSGLLNEGPRDSLCRVKGSLIMIQGFIVLKRLNYYHNIDNSCLLNQRYIKIGIHR